MSQLIPFQTTAAALRHEEAHSRFLDLCDISYQFYTPAALTLSTEWTGGRSGRYGEVNIIDLTGTRTQTLRSYSSQTVDISIRYPLSCNNVFSDRAPGPDYTVSYHEERTVRLSLCLDRDPSSLRGSPVNMVQFRAFSVETTRLWLVVLLSYPSDSQLFVRVSSNVISLQLCTHQTCWYIIQVIQYTI
jgi:hypothetical protein